MSVLEEIARQKAALAVFATSAAAAVFAEDMTDAQRGTAALDVLRLVVASGLQAPAHPVIEIAPAPERPRFQPYAKRDAAKARKELRTAPAAPAPRQEIEAPAPAEPVVEPAPLADPDPVIEILSAPGDATPVPRPRSGGRQRGFSDQQLLDAVRRHGNNTAAIAEEFSVTSGYINVQRRRLGCPAPKGRQKQATAAKSPVLVAETVTTQHILWDDENRAKLAALLAEVPPLSKEAIAAKMGITVSAVQTAMSRLGMSRPDGHADRKMRTCLSCEKSFMSEWKGNRHCTQCKHSEAA